MGIETRTPFRLGGDALNALSTQQLQDYVVNRSVDIATAEYYKRWDDVLVHQQLLEQASAALARRVKAEVQVA